jgi:hypothetical protein
MIEFFKEGGWGMWPILFMGVAVLAASARYAWQPEKQRLGFICAMAAATLLSTITATLSDVGTVCFAVAQDPRFADADKKAVFLEGMKESTRPGVFGTTVLSVAALLVAAGMSRRTRTEES